MSLCIFKTPRLKAISRKLPERNTKECSQKEKKKKKKNDASSILFCKAYHHDTGKPPRKKFSHPIILAVW